MKEDIVLSFSARCMPPIIFRSWFRLQSLRGYELILQGCLGTKCCLIVNSNIVINRCAVSSFFLNQDKLTFS